MTCLVFASLVFTTVNVYSYITNKDDKSEEISNGVNIIKSLEKKEVSKSQEAIDMVQDTLPQDEDRTIQDNSEITKKENNDTTSNVDNIDFNSKFSTSVILGDSRAESIVEYQILNNSSVVAYKGRSLITAINYGDIDKAINLAPKNIFLTYGLNDVESYTDSSKFISDYKKVIEKIKTKLPKTKVLVNSIFEVTNKGLNSTPAYKKIPQYNEALKKMCEEINIPYIDGSCLFKENLYDADGIHFTPNLNKQWLNLLIEKANL